MQLRTYERRFDHLATCNLPSYFTHNQVQVVLSEMSLQKKLCLICERPTADGAVLAVQVDKEKLQTWFLNVCEYELEEEIEDKDKICYFCLWHAEFQWKFEEMMNEELVWWPRNLDNLDDEAKELRRNYFEGKLEQCWVQLEKIELPESESEDDGRPMALRSPCFTCNLQSSIQVQVVLSVMSVQKALCLICELPTADGAVSAVHVDKEKLKTWFLNACEYELAEEIEDDDLICYFCVCHAEFQWKFDEMADENLVWWNLDLDDAARELRKNYFEGKLEQCFVQLEKIELPESESEDVGRPSEAKQQSHIRRKNTRKRSDVKITTVQHISTLLKRKKSTT
ncbi:Hypothetical predicted protein [Cloeon dipterum]|uniref:Uncharacterized protein n=1 Tax=Cloeon dipterum TaxID=197152 RepID=A0A8S1DWU7_9INSE|nr:Hypothetical predicted protein [Cloeon dipterum]